MVLLSAGLSSAPSYHATRSAKPRPIVVNSIETTVTGDDINLARAVSLAGQDPSDNTIQFAPEVLRGTTRIALPSPLTTSARSGNDRIEGPTQGGLVLDGSACPDAGIIVGDRSSLTLINITVQGGKQRAILVKEKGRLELANVVVQSRSGPGIALFGDSQADIANSRLLGSPTHGIEVHGGSVVRLQDTVISGSGQSGIAGFEHTRITALGVRLDRNGHWNLVLTGDAQAELSNCTLTGAAFANADVSENTRLDLRNCTVEQSRRFGLFATGHTSVTLAGTSIVNQSGRGIEAQDSARLFMQAAEVDSNADYGAILFENCSIQAVACKFTRNKGHGVSLRGRATGDFKACLFADNHYSGLGCMDAADGGSMTASQCIFRGNGMRPIYRGPLHLDPLVPTPLSIDADSVLCAADPDATVELYFDRAGEASRYFKAIRADGRGQFRVNRSDVPPGWVMTATATTDGSTSEFNVVAGSDSPDLLGALLAQTGPLSDTGGATNLDGSMRRWRSGTKLVLQVANPPSAAVERYARFVVAHVADWTHGAIQASLCASATDPKPANAVIVPVSYMPADSEPLLGRGGVTFMKWDNQGYFISPMRILLARSKQSQETCPRVLAHEFGHVLGLCHARVGLLSRMQGSTPPSEAFVNDFSPTLTYYDVLALHILHDPSWKVQGTLRRAMAAGMLPPAPVTAMASIEPAGDHPTYSPAPAQPRREEASHAGRSPR